MRNLKRALSLVLAAMMLVGMMVVGASAVSFNDGDKINHTDAVNTMATLNVIHGKPDGNFDPEGAVSRAEMAKMICVALNGGKDFSYGSSGTTKFVDVPATHWARNYIEYCVNLGIIAGNGDGTFNPEGPVTGSAAAKMMLVAIGYDATDAGLAGTADWEINTNILAGQKDLYKDMNVNPGNPLNRDDAAQLTYNGVRATMVEYTYNAQSVNGTLTMVPQVKEKTHFVNGTEYKSTILSEKFGLSEAEGILNAVDYVEAAGKEPEKFVYTVNEDGNVVDTNGNGEVVTTFSADVNDYSNLLGEKVSALYKVENGKRVLYGIYGKSDAVVNFARGEISLKADNTIDGTKKSIKANGETYNLTNTASAIPYYTYDSATGKLVNAGMLNGLTNIAAVSNVKLVCNSATGKYEYAIATPSSVAKITFKSSSSVTMNNGVGAYDLDDITIYDGAKKGDFIIFTSDKYTVKGVADVAKTETISGKVGAMRNTDEIRVDGVWYKNGGNATVPSVNDQVTLVVVGNYYYDADTTSSKSIDNVLFVAEAVDKATVGDAKVEASVAFADGTIQTINISKVDDTTAAASNTTNDYGTAGKVVEGGMYTYSKASSGVYELTKLADTANERAGFDKFDTSGTFTSSSTTPKVGTYYIADDAVVFVRSTLSGKEKTKVITGAELNDWAANWGTSAQVLANKVDGNMTAKAVALIGSTAIPGSTGSSGYGLVTETGYYVKEDGTAYAVMSIWNGEEDLVDVKAEKVHNGSQLAAPAANVNTWAAAKKGAFVSYEVLKNGNITDVQVVGTAAALVGKYTNKDGDTTLTFEDDAYTGDADSYEGTITDKTKVIYVDTANSKGAEGSGYELATETAVAKYFIKNVVYAKNGTNAANLDVIFIDVANNLDGNSDAKTAAIASDLTTTSIHGTTLYTGSSVSIDASKVKVVAADGAAGTGEIVFKGALAVSVVDAAGNVKTSGNLDNNWIVTVVAEDGSTTSYVVVADTYTAPAA